MDGGSRGGELGLARRGRLCRRLAGRGQVRGRFGCCMRGGGGVKGLVPGNFAAPPPPAPWLCSNARRRTAESTWRGLRREGGIPADAGEGRRGLVVWVCAFPGGQGAWTGLPGACMGWAGLWGWMDGWRGPLAGEGHLPLPSRASGGESVFWGLSDAVFVCTLRPPELTAYFSPHRFHRPCTGWGGGEKAAEVGLPRRALGGACQGGEGQRNKVWPSLRCRSWIDLWLGAAGCRCAPVSL